MTYKHENIVAKPSKEPTLYLDAVEKLIDACLSDTEVVYVVEPDGSSDS